MALLFLDSFDHYDTSQIALKWNNVINIGGLNPPTIVPGKHGNGIAPGSGVTRTLAVPGVAGPNFVALAAGFWIYLTNGSIDGGHIASFYQPLSDTKFILDQAGDGRLRFVLSAHNVPDLFTLYSSTALAQKTWYYLQMRCTLEIQVIDSANFKVGASDWELRLLNQVLISRATAPMGHQLDSVNTVFWGTFPDSITFWNTPTDSIETLKFSSFALLKSSSIVDDLYVTDGAFLPFVNLRSGKPLDPRIDCLYPRSDGTKNEFTPKVAGPNYLMVNAHTPNLGSTYVSDPAGTLYDIWVRQCIETIIIDNFEYADRTALASSWSISTDTDLFTGREGKGVFVGRGMSRPFLCGITALKTAHASAGFALRTTNNLEAGGLIAGLQSSLFNTSIVIGNWGDGRLNAALGAPDVYALVTAPSSFAMHPGVYYYIELWGRLIITLFDMSPFGDRYTVDGQVQVKVNGKIWINQDIIHNSLAQVPHGTPIEDMYFDSFQFGSGTGGVVDDFYASNSDYPTPFPQSATPFLGDVWPKNINASSPPPNIPPYPNQYDDGTETEEYYMDRINGPAAIHGVQSLSLVRGALVGESKIYPSYRAGGGARMQGPEWRPSSGDDNFAAFGYDIDPLAVNPFTMNPFTVSEINAMQFGIVRQKGG